MKREYPRFRPCFETMVGAGLNLSTRVLVDFTIEADGSVSSASRVEDEFASEQFIDCVLHEVGELRFPRLEQGTDSRSLSHWRVLALNQRR